MARWSRRYFLGAGGAVLFGVGTGAFALPPFLARAAARTRKRGRTLVVIFLRGAADGLNVVVPYGERAYYELRPTIAIAPPGKGGGAIDLNGFFGLHPVLGAFKRLYDEKLLAVIQAVGSPDTTRSHFDAQDFMESGTPGLKSTRDGWLNRCLQARPVEGEATFRAVSATAELPRILAGAAPSLAIPRLSRFGLPDTPVAAIARHGLERIWAESDDPTLGPTGREAFEAIRWLERARPEGHRAASGAVYPPGPFGASLQQIAQLIKSGAGLEIAFTEMGGWDHHVAEGAAEGPLARLLRQLASGVEAFARDLGDRMQDVVLVTLSEFGRSARENGNLGTDHGHASAMLVLGGPVRGGRVYGEWPGLEPEQMFEQRDLALTTDFRDVVGEVLIGHLGTPTLDAVFPGHSRKRIGLIES